MITDLQIIRCSQKQITSKEIAMGMQMARIAVADNRMEGSLTKNGPEDEPPGPKVGSGES